MSLTAYRGKAAHHNRLQTAIRRRIDREHPYRRFVRLGGVLATLAMLFCGRFVKGSFAEWFYIGAALLFIAQGIYTLSHRAPHPRWFNLMMFAGIGSSVLLLFPILLLLAGELEGEGTREFVIIMFGFAAVCAILFGYALYRYRRVRRASRAAVEQIERRAARRKKLELL